MDPDYQLDAGTAAVVANLTAVTTAVEEVASKASTTLPSSFVESLPTIGTVPGFNTTMLASPVTWATTYSTTTPVTPVSQISESAGDLGKRLEEGLKQVQETLQHLNRSPAVVVINPPAASPPDWTSHVDTTLVGSVSTVVLLLFLVVGGLWLRRYRPDTWKNCKAVMVRGLKILALPASWAFSKASDALRRFHHDTSDSVETGQQAAVLQV